jgi:hypothetical protein
MNKVTLSEIVRTFGVMQVVMAFMVNQNYFDLTVALLYISGIGTYILGLFVNDDFEL